MRLRHAGVLALGALLLLGTVQVGLAQRRPPKPHRAGTHRPRPHKETPAQAPAPPPVPAAIRENSYPGTSDWNGPIAPGSTAEVWASATDALPGDQVPLHVSTAPAAPYRIVVYRLGWYGGAGARQVACLPSCDGQEQGQPQAAPVQTSHGIVAPWPTTDTLTIDQTWVSGYYEIRVEVLDGPARGTSAYTWVIVNAPQPTAMLVQVPTNTWQAYNSWGGRSLYSFPGIGHADTSVSYDRPYSHGGPGNQAGPLGWELPFVRFVERTGYDVSYQSDVYTDAHPESLLQHKLVAVIGHSEYWTKTMRDAFETARDQKAVNLAFMGANDAYWQVRLLDGGRTAFSYKSMLDPEPDVRLKTAMFREIGRRECELEGIQHQGAWPLNWPPGDYTVAAPASDPWFAGTGFATGDVVRGIVSVESDAIPGTETAAASCGHALTVLFHREHGGDKDGNADAIRYTNFNGALVFASGSHQFSWGLDDIGTPGTADPRLQAFMKNALDAMTR